MKYQLVLQFAAASMDDFDRLVALENSLIEELDSLATIDGHDFGLGDVANNSLERETNGCDCTVVSSEESGAE